MRVAVAAGVVSTFLPKSPVSADPFGSISADTGPAADSSLHTYCDGSLDPGEFDNAVSAMNYLESSTDMSVANAGNCQAATDVRFDIGNGLPANVRGRYTCLVWETSPTVCDGGRVQTNVATLAAGADYENNLDKTIRHEVGHSVGLTHYKSANFPNPPNGENDAMVSGAVDGDPLWTLYGNHHKDHINNAH